MSSAEASATAVAIVILALHAFYAFHIGAIAHKIEANRGRERWGVVTLEQAFEGFAQLPPVAIWWRTLGFEGPPVNAETLRVRFRELAREHHPDRGGDAGRMSALNAAYEEGLAALQKQRESA